MKTIVFDLTALVLTACIMVVAAHAHDDHEKEPEMVCFELPKQECGCGLAQLVEEKPETVCFPVVKDETESK